LERFGAYTSETFKIKPANFILFLVSNFLNMNTRILFSIALILSGLLIGCKPKDPSILKVYVRNYNNILEKEAEVILVLKSEVLSEFYLTSITNMNGYAVFNLDEFFSQFAPKEEKVADFKAYATSKNGKTGDQMARPRAHITSSITINLEQ
jgi:hypothetical protein